MEKANFYASTLFAEHPIAIWPLDEDLTYISMLKYIDKEPLTDSTWQKTQCTVALADPLPHDIPLDEPVYSIVANTLVGDDISPATILLDNSFTKATGINRPVTISAHVCSKAGIVANYEIGVVNNDTSLSKTEYTGQLQGVWHRIHHSFYPSQSFKIYLKITYLDNIGTVIGSDTYINMLCAGELAENYSSVEPGIEMLASDTLADELQMLLFNNTDTDYRLFKANPYGMDPDDFGYYIIKDGNSWSGCNMLARNQGIPMVYGTDNCSAIYNDQSPSIIVPAKDFMHANGNNYSFTFEFWMRQGNLNAAPAGQFNTSRMTKIFGPLDSNDGLWRDETNLYLVANEHFGSYCIGQWYRPTLVSIRYAPGLIELLVNGEVVVSLQLHSTFAFTAHSNWLGFWNPDTDVFELDCIAMYPYAIVNNRIKRHFVMGQGTEELNVIESNYLGTSYSIDYPRAGYITDWSYPKNTKWSDGYSVNADTSSNNLSGRAARYPGIIYDNNNIDYGIWITACEIAQQDDQPFVTLTPQIYTADPAVQEYFQANPKGMLLFESIDTSDQRPAAIILDIETRLADEYIGRLVNTINNYEITISVRSSKLWLNNYNTNKTVTAGTRYEMILDLDAIVASYSSFEQVLKNMNAVRLEIGGNLSTNFYGKIYAVTFVDRFFAALDSIPAVLAVNAKSDAAYVGTYTYAPQLIFGRLRHDIASRCYWEAKIPLAHFARKVSNESGAQNRLDVLQANISIDNGFINTLSTTKYTHGGTTPQQIFATLRFIDKDKANTENHGYITPVVADYYDLLNYPAETMFMLKEESVFTIPESIDIENTYVQIQIILASYATLYKPTWLKRLELSSFTFDASDSFFNAIGTRFGQPIYPFKEQGTMYLHPDNTALAISKETVPYLYLTHNSGVMVKDDDSGIFFGYNANYVQDKKLAGLKFFVKLDKIPAANKKIGEIRLALDTEDEVIEIWATPRDIDDSVPSAYITFTDTSQVAYVDGAAYQDGYYIVNGTLEQNRWSAVYLIFDSYRELQGPASIKFYSGARIQHVSFHEAFEFAIFQRFFMRSWYFVKNTPSENIWEQIKYTDYPTDTDSQSWGDLLFGNDAASFYFEAENMHAALCGTVGIIADDISSGNSIAITPKSMAIVTDALWSDNIYRPV